MLRTFGKFELIRPLGRGAMGEVYLAKDPAIGREVAIKTIRPEVLLAPDARERFIREAKAAGTLNHPHLVTIHEFGEAEGGLYLAMEFVEGKDLSALLRDRSLTPAEILEVMAQICDGLAYAHGKGILHRDIKPSNIRVARVSGRPFAKVMDFGIAHLAGSDMTGTGTLLGTFGYMAPEYVQSGQPTPQTDLFAVGVMLHEAFAGERPFHGDTTATILFKVVNDHPRPIDAARFEGVSPRTGALIRRALAKDPARRFADAAELAAMLRAAQDPAWIGPEGAGGNQPTRMSAPGDLKTVGLPRAGATPGAGPRTVTIIRTVPEPEPAQNPWGWVAAGAAILVAGWLWLGSRGDGPRPGAQEPAPQAQPAGATGLRPQPPAGAEPVRPEPAPNPALTATEPAPNPAQPQVQEPARQAPPPPPESRPLDLGEGERVLSREPQAALQAANAQLAVDPGSKRALALKVAALYKLERFGGMAEVFRDAHQNGIVFPDLAGEPVVKDMLAEESRAHRIPQAMRQRLPPPLGDGPGGPGGGPREPRP